MALFDNINSRYTKSAVQTKGQRSFDETTKPQVNQNISVIAQIMNRYK